MSQLFHIYTQHPDAAWMYQTPPLEVQVSLFSFYGPHTETYESSSKTFHEPAYVTSTSPSP